jgi:hypothetical protein
MSHGDQSWKNVAFVAMTPSTSPKSWVFVWNVFGVAGKKFLPMLKRFITLLGKDTHFHPNLLKAKMGLFVVSVQITVQ